MVKIKSFFNAFLGISGRHNKALRNVGEWLPMLQKFFNTYELSGSPDISTLLEKAGDAKFDLTSIVYNGRPLAKEAENIKNEDIVKLVADIVNTVEEIRRFLINPVLQGEQLKEAVFNLRASYDTLQDMLSETEYM